MRAQEIDVTGGRHVAIDGVRHIGIDVVLGGAGGIVGGGLLAVDRAPRVERASLAHHLGRACGRRAGSGAGSGAGRRRRRDACRPAVAHIHLGVPEVVAVVAVGGDPLGGDPALADLGRGLGQLEQVPPNRLLRRRVAVDRDVGALPEGVEPGAMLGDDGVPSRRLPPRREWRRSGRRAPRCWRRRARRQPDRRCGTRGTSRTRRARRAGSTVNVVVAMSSIAVVSAAVGWPP